jgi:hypothetical protein
MSKFSRNANRPIGCGPRAAMFVVVALVSTLALSAARDAGLPQAAAQDATQPPAKKPADDKKSGDK